MSKARDLANAGTALTTVSATELGYLDGVTSAVQTQIDSKEATLPSQTGNSGKYLTTNGTAKSWGTVSQYALPSQTGNSGKFLTTNGTAESWGTVNQPLTWTNRATFEHGLTSIAYNGTDLYVAVGSSERLLSSPDGITWTERTSGFTGGSSINKVAFGNGLWVAVGGGGQITTSTNGTTWTARTANMSTNTINDVLYANSIWVAVGAGGGTTNTGGITYSTDGTTWTRKSQSLTIGTGYATVMYNGTNWIVGSSLSTNNYIYASTPSGTWTAGHTGTSLSIRNFFYDGTRTLEIPSDGSLRYSTSATVGTTTQLDGIQLRNANQYNYYYNGKIYSMGQLIMVVDTTPQTGDRGKVYLPLISPGMQIDQNGTPVDRSATIFVGSAGYIVSSLYSSSSQIFTSF
jgi:hypothetical protein